MKIVLAVAAIALLLSPLSAQTVVPASVPLVAGQSDTVLRVGTPVPLTMSEALTTKGKKLKVGYRFRMEVSEAVLLNSQVVIPAGSPAVGEVTDVRNKGMWGKSGHINARVLYVTVNGRQIRLSGQLDDKGVTGTAGVVAAVALIPVAGFFTTGTSASIPVGVPIKGFLDEDVPVAFSASAPVAPLAAVPAPVVEPTTEPAAASE